MILLNTFISAVEQPRIPVRCPNVKAYVGPGLLNQSGALTKSILVLQLIDQFLEVIYKLMRINLFKFVIRL